MSDVAADDQAEARELAELEALSELEELPALIAVGARDTRNRIWTVEPRPGLLTPVSVTATWTSLPEQPVTVAFDKGEVDLDAQAALEWLLRVAESLVADHFLGRALLATWSIRHDGSKVVTAAAPGFSDGTSSWEAPFGDPPPPGPQRDLYLLGAVLFRAVTGRWAASRLDATETAAVLGGSWPPGVELAARMCLHPDPDRAAQTAAHLLDVVRAVLSGANGNAQVPLVVAQESITGWRKAHGRPGGDNEDRVVWDRVGSTVVALVADGVSGHSDGAGQLAARFLASYAARSWCEGEHDPDRVLQDADARLRQLAHGGEHAPAATAMAVRISDRGRLDLASVGDSLAFLCRPTTRGVVVTRLNAEHSRVAERLTAGESADPADDGVITMACGVGPPVIPHTTSLSLLAGDRLVLMTDGAGKADAADAGRSCWSFMDQLADLTAGDPYPALLASLLCRRADDLGGYDNATVLVLGAVSRSDSDAASIPVSPRVRSIATGVA